MTKPTVVYVQQYDAFWKFTMAEWLEFVKAYLKNPALGYTLPYTKQMKRRPRAIGATDLDGDGRKSYYASVNKALLVEPLDWDEETFTEHLKELERP